MLSKLETTSLSFIFLFTACGILAPGPAILAPAPGQLVAAPDLFEVEIQASSARFDLSTLEAEVDGQSLEIQTDDSFHTASLPPVLTPDRDYVLSVSAFNKWTQRVETSTVSFTHRTPPGANEYFTEFVSRPPVVETSSIEVVNPERKHQNALLKVRFRDQMPSQQPIPFRIDEQTFFYLRDDGAGDDEIPHDLIFTARMDFDEEAFHAREVEEFERAMSSDEEPAWMSFAGRELESLTPIDPDEVAASLSKPKLKWTISTIGFPVVDPERALLIRDLSVVGDPMRTFDLCDSDADGLKGDPDGAWTFKTLMTHLANMGRTGISPEQFVTEWLKGWRRNFDLAADGSSTGDWVINGDVVPEREVNLLGAIINNWPKTSSGTLDLDEAPFRLLAIVNRTDLTDAVGFSSSAASAGELRFVFGLVDPITCLPSPMSVIFEYDVPVKDCLEAVTYAQQWDDLDTRHPRFPARPGYLKALQAITDPIVIADAAPSRPNGSNLGQLRTSEATMGLPWEMREFTLQSLPSGSPGQNTLRLTTTKQTPDIDFTGIPTLKTILVDYINSAGADICDEVHEVPDTFKSMDFLAGRADFTPSTFFDPGTVGAAGSCSGVEVRHKFSLNTCSGCHAAETIHPNPAVDKPFYHIHPDTAAGGPVELSRFLTGTGKGVGGASTVPIPDPSVATVNRHFNDLKRRGFHMRSMLKYMCVAFTASGGLGTSVH